MNRFATLALVLTSWLPAYAQQQDGKALKEKNTDVVVMKNGDHFTGKVKKLENGMLSMDVDYIADTIQLDWLQVDKVQSSSEFQVTLDTGDRIVGKIQKVPEKDDPKADFHIAGTNGETKNDAKQIIDIQSQKQGFWHQLTGAINFGYDFTSGNAQNSLTSDASANYLATKWLAGVSSTTSFSGQSGNSITNLLEVQTQDGLFLSHNSYLLGLGDFLHSSQQSLDLRTTLGGGYARYLIRNNHSTFVWLAGAVYTHEKFAPTSEQNADQNIEALLGVQYNLFHFTRYQLQSSVLVYPGLSDFGRVRATPKITFTVKLPNNFSSNLSFWDNYDSRPPPDSKGNELGISSGLGWTF